MILLELFGILDSITLLLLLGCVVDGSRLVMWRYEPLRAAGYLSLGIGVLGSLGYYSAANWQVAAFQWLVHVGIATLFILHLRRRLKHPQRNELKSERRLIYYGRHHRRHIRRSF